MHPAIGRSRGHGADIPYRTAQVPLLNIAQLLFHDPAGNGVELQFDEAEPAV